VRYVAPLTRHRTRGSGRRTRPAIGTRTVGFDTIGFERLSYDPTVAYGRSRTANVLLAVEAGLRWADEGDYRHRRSAARLWNASEETVPAR
jgi:hypothetical protein